MSENTAKENATKSKIESKTEGRREATNNFVAICYESEGRSHIQSNTPCQDKTYSLLDSGFASIVLCDGAGSAKYSHFGVERTSRIVAELLKEKFESFYTASEPRKVAKEIIETINKELQNLAKDKTKELQDSAYKTIQEILKKSESHLKTLDYNSVNFDYKNELEKRRDTLTTDIKKLQKDKDEYNANHKAYIEDFKNEAQELREDYEEKINNARRAYIKILKKQEKKSLTGRFIDGIKSWWNNKKENTDEIEKLESTQKQIQTYINNETTKLQDFTKKIELKLHEIEKSNQVKIQEILNTLEKIGNEILDFLKAIYKNIKRHIQTLENGLNKHKDKLELQQGVVHNHIITTKEGFKNLLTSFVSLYEKAITRQEALYTEAIQTKEKEKQKLESALQKHTKLQTSLRNCVKDFHSAKKALQENITKLLQRSKTQFYSVSDMASLESSTLKNAQEKLENVRKESLAFIKSLDSIQNKDAKALEKEILCNIESLHRVKEEIEKSTCEVKDLASTLLFVAVDNDECLIGHLGDGAIGACYGEELRCISNPDNGEHANETYFVTSKNAELALKIFKANRKEKDINAFVLMSDGSTEGLYSKKDSKFIPLLQKQILEIKDRGKEKQKDIESLIERVKNEKSFDDCSIAILARTF